MHVKMSPIRIVLLSFLGVFLADIVITSVLDSYFMRREYTGILMPYSIPTIIASAISIAVGIALFFRFRGKISDTPLSGLAMAISVLLLFLCASTCVSTLYYPTVQVFQEIIPGGWLAVNIPSVAHFPAMWLQNASASFIRLICGGELPNGFMGKLPVYVYNGALDLISIICSFTAAYCLHRLRRLRRPIASGRSTHFSTITDI